MKIYNVYGTELYSDYSQTMLETVEAAVKSEVILDGASLDGARIIRMDFGSWSVCIYHDRTQIGCQLHPNTDWLSWSPDSAQIAKMHGNAPAFWAAHQDMIKAGIRWAMQQETTP